MKRMRWLVPSLVIARVCWVGTLAAQEEKKEEANAPAVAKAVLGARVSLERGLAASAAQGQPISGKFEIEDGHFQLSVYTAKGGKFSEVIVDHSTGMVAKVEAITEGDDLRGATEQSAAMGKAKVSLQAAVQKAVRANAGFRAVSIVPSLKEGHPVAHVTLAKGDETKAVSVPLE